MKTSKIKNTLVSLVMGWLVCTAAYSLQSASPAPLQPARSASATSYAEVTAKLDRGGDLFAYLSTAKWLHDLSGKLGDLRKVVMDLVPEDERDVMNLAFDAGVRFLQSSGMEEISGVGMSAVTVEKGIYRTKTIIHHHKNRGAGYVWSLFGAKPHALTGIDLMPADAVIANYNDFDVKGLWSTVTNELITLGTPEIRAAVAQAPMQFQAIVGMDLGKFMDGLGGEFGWALLLNEKARMPLPIPGTGMIDIPTPGLMLVARVTDKAIFDRISDQLGGMLPNILKVEEDGAQQLRVPALIPFVPALQPVVAYDGEHLIITSNPMLMKKVLATKQGNEPNLRSNPQFKQLAAGLPKEGNAFFFISDRITKEYIEIQKKLMPVSNAVGPQIMGPQIMNAMNTPVFMASVFSNTDEGWMWTSVGNQSAAEGIAVAMIAAPALMVGIAVPNIVKARSTAQRTSNNAGHRTTCIANLKQIDGAVQRWALVKKRISTDKPEKDPVLEYMRGGRLPTCPAGGTYSLGETVSQDPTCSHPGHNL